MPALTDSTRTADATSGTLTALRDALEQVTADPLALSLAGSVPAAPDPDGDLASWLYARWWVGTGHSGPAALDPPPPEHAVDDRYLVAALEESRRGGSHVVPGLLVLAVTGDRLLVAQVPGVLDEDDPSLPQPAVVALDAVATSSRPGRPPRPGDLVGVLSGSSGVQAGTGWWWARTALDPSLEDLGGDLDRLYLNATTEGAPVVVGAVLRAAAAAGLALSLKCPSEATGFGRRDAVVVYHRRADRAEVDAVLPDVLGRVARWLDDGVPPLTRPVAAGAAWAQDPGQGLSYGQLRCGQVAALVGDLVRAGRTAATDADLLTAARAVGIDPARPHLLTGSAS